MTRSTRRRHVLGVGSILLGAALVVIGVLFAGDHLESRVRLLRHEASDAHPLADVPASMARAKLETGPTPCISTREQSFSKECDSTRPASDAECVVLVTEDITGSPVPDAIVQGVAVGLGGSTSPRTDDQGAARIPFDQNGRSDRNVVVSAAGYFDRSIVLTGGTRQLVTLQRRCRMSGIIDDQMGSNSIIGVACGLFALITPDATSESATRLRKLLHSSAGLARLTELRKAAYASRSPDLEKDSFSLVVDGDSRITNVMIKADRRFCIEDLHFGDRCRLALVDFNADPIVRDHAIVRAEQDAGSIRLPPICCLRVYVSDPSDAPIPPDAGLIVTCVNTKLLDDGEGGDAIWRESPLRLRSDEGRTCAYFTCTVGEEYVVSVRDRVATGVLSVRIPRDVHFTSTYLQVLDRGQVESKRIRVLDPEGTSLAGACLMLRAQDGTALGACAADEGGNLSFSYRSSSDLATITAPGHQAVVAVASDLAESVVMQAVARRAIGPLVGPCGELVSANAEIWSFDGAGVAETTSVKLEAGMVQVPLPAPDTSQQYLAVQGHVPVCIFDGTGEGGCEGALELQQALPCRIRVSGARVDGRSLTDRDLMKCIFVTQRMPGHPELRKRTCIELDASLAGRLELWTATAAVHVAWLRYRGLEDLEIGEVRPEARGGLELPIRFPF